MTLKFIINTQKIIGFLGCAKISPTDFCQKNGIAPKTFNKAIGGEPVIMSVVKRIADGAGFNTNSIIDQFVV